MSTLFTLGHGALRAEQFVALLRAGGVEVAADVRRFPGSRRHPQFGASEMRRWLAAAGLHYEPFPELGGRRMPLPDSPNVGLRNSAFRGFADYIATTAFHAAFEVLVELARERPVAVFCAETLWWTCHRRLIADAAVLLAGFEVRHLTPTRSSHVLTPGVQRVDDRLIYLPAA